MLDSEQSRRGGAVPGQPAAPERIDGGRARRVARKEIARWTRVVKEARIPPE
jgi:hypothetical protein